MTCFSLGSAQARPRGPRRIGEGERSVLVVTSLLGAGLFVGRAGTALGRLGNGAFRRRERCRDGLATFLTFGGRYCRVTRSRGVGSATTHFNDGVCEPRRNELNRTDGVVVAGDDVIEYVRVGVGIGESATTGIPSLFASRTAMASFVGSMTKSTSGRRVISLIPPR